MTKTGVASSAVSIDELSSFFAAAFPDRKGLPRHTAVGYGTVSLELDCNERHLRPPDFINGPTQMAIADHAAYVAIFTRVGVTPMAMTSNLNINFLRPCRGEKLIADAEVLKFGKANVVIEVNLRGSSSEKISSHAIVTYVLPKD